MKVTEKNIILCLECESSFENCFCSCPYCGKETEDCCCALKKSKGTDRILSKSHDPKHGLMRSSKSVTVNTKDDDWWRLEKWQVGRRKFP